MSWQTYVDAHLLDTKVVNQAAIAGHDGSVWAASADFKITNEEIKKILQNFNDSDVLATSGVTVANTKYFFLSCNEKVIRAKKGLEGLHIMKTVQAIIIAQYKEPTVPEQCAAVTEKLGEYLITTGF